MSYLKLSLSVGELDPGVLEFVLFELGALSVSVEPLGPEPILEPETGSTPLSSRIRMRALFEQKQDKAALEKALCGALRTDLAPSCTWTYLENRDWVTDFRESQKPRRFGDRLWICPHGQTIPSACGDAVVVRLDPGLAFGTGRHPSTRLCLNWLAANPPSGLRIIDYGTGSGILALAALKLGAGDAVATDIDPQAIGAAGKNAVLNGVEDRLTANPVHTLPSEPCDLLLANILAQPLIELSERFAELVASGGRIVLSGFLRGQASALAVTYQKWFDMADPVFEDEWALIAGVRNGRS